MIERLRRLWSALGAVAVGDTERQIDEMRANVAVVRRRVDSLVAQHWLLQQFVEQRHASWCTQRNPELVSLIDGKKCSACQVLEECKKIQQSNDSRVDA